MRKITTVLLILIFLVKLPAASASPDGKEHLIEDALLSAITPAIDNAIAGYYGSPRLFGLYDAKILKVEREQAGGYLFKVTVQVKTFTGPHNPPFGIETITLAVEPGHIMVTDFHHKEG
ncbi:DUF3888 domain-containing protein [Paenibacillus sp. HN-1]|uniref:DUF3888 domain-containing protein n=1 Tax=Paenibacillus TaxID=44249 RepID=UPI001CAA0CA8|nr:MULTISPECIES: DUF3888 domain-containing protein [Paenibacillus]MBY9081022.1 DUF3888 domain-containing protein [Paenibacillus sp. CGMCC 1.18879]MBY9087059.1 DUF3888 domain-containing protein [Paenibacillus sinensis]